MLRSSSFRPPSARRPVRLGRAVRSLLLAASSPAALVFAVTACEPRVEEPTPPPLRTEEPKLRGASTDRAAIGQPKAKCIKKTPATPARIARPGADPTCPADPLTTPPKLRAGKVAFPDAQGQEISVEIAEADQTRQRGLMFRKQMADNHGMIFLFEARENHSFWMHNTCIPLDMLFIDDDGVIVGIEENTPTMNDSTFDVGCPSRYVLEVNAGWTRRNGVQAGQRVDLKDI